MNERNAGLLYSAEGRLVPARWVGPRGIDRLG